MPYNNTPIDPPKLGDYTGQANLPLARVKKIINADDDIAACSNNAAFAITIATEAFIRHLAEQTHNVVRTERRPRRHVAYKDVATAVHKYDNLEFLLDVVPRTITYKQWKDKQERLEKKEQDAQKGKDANGVVNGEGETKGAQRTLHAMMAERERRNGESVPVGSDGAADEEDGDAEMEEGEGVRVNGVNGDETEDEDVEGAAASRARHSYDAMQNGGGTRPEAELPMEED